MRIHYATRHHGAICGKKGSDYASSALKTSVNCPKCIDVLKSHECRQAAESLLSERPVDQL